MEDELVKYTRKQYRMLQVTAVCSVLILGIVLYTAVTIVGKVNRTYQNMEMIMQDMQTITSELAETDLQKMLTDVDQLVVTSENNINQAMEKVNSINVDELNRAIKNLSDVVEPFADFFNGFR